MKCNCEINKDVQKELNFKIKILSLILLIIGSISFLVYFIYYFITDITLYYPLYISIPFLGIGIALMYLIKKNIQNAEKNIFTVYYEFFEDYMEIESYKKEELISKTKYYYKDIVKISESKHYLFLYPNTVSAFPILKNQLSTDDLNTLKNLINSKKSKK